MGRPPIGRKAMTGAERIRRFREKHRVVKTVTKPVTKLDGADAGKVAALEAKIVVLEGLLADARNQGGDPAVLSKSGRERLDAAIRHHKKRLDREFSWRLHEESVRWMEEMRIPSMEKEWKHVIKMLENRRGHLTRAQFNLIRACIHPDANMTEKKRNEAFNMISNLELLLVKDSDPAFTLPDWDELEAQVRAKRAAARARK
jgi:hypothetical protein